MQTAIVVLVATLALVTPAFAQRPVGPAYVTRVVSGDLVYAEIGGRIEAIHYIGASVPLVQHPTRGSEPYADISREMNRRLVEGKWIRLVVDEPARDRDGRLQAYVWVRDLFVNAALIHWGYADAAPSLQHPRYRSYFESLEQGARRAHRGLWGYGDVLAYYRPRPTDIDPDSGDYRERAANASGGRVFSAPAPFIPSVGAPSTGSTGAANVGLPGGPTSMPPGRSTGPVYSTPARR